MFVAIVAGLSAADAEWAVLFKPESFRPLIESASLPGKAAGDCSILLRLDMPVRLPEVGMLILMPDPLEPLGDDGILLLPEDGVSASAPDIGAGPLLGEGGIAPIIEEGEPPPGLEAEVLPTALDDPSVCPVPILVDEPEMLPLDPLSLATWVL